MKRKEFIGLGTTAMLLLANGRIAKAHEFLADKMERSKVLFRFAVASDGHYGQQGTDFENYFSAIVGAINAEHAKQPFSFAVINGDIVHDDKQQFPAAKNALDKLECKYYVSQGNHDHVTPHEWESIWGMPVNLDFTHKNNSFLIGTTSNESGVYLCPDHEWFSEKLEQHKNTQVYIFIHINPGALTRHGIECAPLFELFAKYPNIRAVFNGHDHDEDNIKVKNDIPFVFDSHFGGSWGTDYRGYRIVEVMNDGSALTYIMNPSTMINKANIS